MSKRIYSSFHPTKGHAQFLRAKFSFGSVVLILLGALVTTEILNHLLFEVVTLPPAYEATLHVILSTLIVLIFVLAFMLKPYQRQNDRLITFTQALEQSPASIVITNTDGYIEYVNPKFEEITGYTYEEALGKNPRILKSGRMSQKTYEDLWNTITKGGTWRGELCNQKKSGELFWEAASISGIRNQEGEIIQFLAVKEDITKKIQAREDHQRLALIVENSRDFIVFASFDERLVYINPAGKKMVGLEDRKSVTDLNIEDMSSEESYRTFREKILPTVLKEGHWSGELGILHKKSGNEILCDFQAMTIRNPSTGKPYGFVGIGHDVTKAKDLEHRLWESQLKLTAILETAPYGIITFDKNHKIESFNPQAEFIFGYPPGEMLGKDLKALMPNLNGAKNSIDIELLTRRGKATESKGQRKNGSTFPLEISVGEAHLENGTLYSAFVRDMTEHKELEGTLHQAQKMESVGHLAGGVAHDFNNLMTVVMSYTELLLQDHEEGSDTHDSLMEIKKAGKSATNLTERLLGFSRRQPAEPRAEDLNELILGTQKMLGRLLPESIEINYLMEDSPCPVYVDPYQIEQILINLVINAVDAMPEGGHMTIQTQKIEFDDTFVRTHRGAVESKMCMMSVSDSGSGMDKETLDQAFDPFFTTKSRGKGTGLGLATCYGIVKQNNGYINLESQPGEGTQAQVYFPVRQPEVGEGDQRPTQHIPELSKGHESILFVEDNQPLRKVCLKALIESGYDVIEAGNGVEALETVKEDPKMSLDLLITDIVMPAMGGLELAKQLAQSQKDMKVLFISGYSDSTNKDRNITQSKTGYLKKPFTPDSLIMKVRKILDY